MPSSQSMFAEARQFTITGGEFNVAGRDMTTITSTSNTAYPTYLEGSEGVLYTSSQHYDDRRQLHRSSENNHVARDQVKVTVVNVLGNDHVAANHQSFTSSIPSSSGFEIPGTNQQDHQPRFRFSLPGIDETEDDMVDDRPSVSSSSTATTSSSISRRDLFSWNISRLGMSISSGTTTMSIIPGHERIYQRMQQLLRALHALNGKERARIPTMVSYAQLISPNHLSRNGSHHRDVGLITPDGAFDFLFNVSLPRGHPVNPDDLYDGFETMPFFSERDIDHRVQFDEGSCLSSGGIYPAPSSDRDAHSFQYGAKEGALIVFPDGAWSTDARNKNTFLQYAERNAEKWYQMRENEVVGHGCCRGLTESDTTSTLPTLTKRWLSLETLWKGSARAYPKPNHPVYNREGVREELNQCTFLRGYRIALQEETWARLFNHPALHVETDDKDAGAEPAHSLPQGKSRSWTSRLFKRNKKNNSNKNHQRRTSDVSSLSSRVIVCSTDDCFQPVLQRDTWHPSHFINQSLLKMHPESKVALTHDDDWCTIVAQQENFDPLDLQNLWEETQKHSSVLNKNGTLYLMPKESTVENVLSEKKDGLPQSNPDSGTRAQMNLHFTHAHASVNVTIIS
ncbi:hypothetical protein BDQ17DRAFT_1428296 [Cyathus striatus]|nr:hypothetical protein BDQ17DRAFT_1428296 [Cyathus striatus]